MERDNVPSQSYMGSDFYIKFSKAVIHFAPLVTYSSSVLRHLARFSEQALISSIITRYDWLVVGFHTGSMFLRVFIHCLQSH